MADSMFSNPYDTQMQFEKMQEDALMKQAQMDPMDFYIYQAGQAGQEAGKGIAGLFGKTPGAATPMMQKQNAIAKIYSKYKDQDKTASVYNEMAKDAEDMQLYDIAEQFRAKSQSTLKASKPSKVQTDELKTQATNILDRPEIIKDFAGVIQGKTFDDDEEELSSDLIKSTKRRMDNYINGFTQWANRTLDKKDLDTILADPYQFSLMFNEWSKTSDPYAQFLGSRLLPGDVNVDKDPMAAINEGLGI